MTVEQDIVHTLARLNMWRRVAINEEEISRQTDVAHAHIDEMLDLWLEEHQVVGLMKGKQS